MRTQRARQVPPGGGGQTWIDDQPQSRTTRALGRRRPGFSVGGARRRGVEHEFTLILRTSAVNIFSTENWFFFVDDPIRPREPAAHAPRAAARPAPDLPRRAAAGSASSVPVDRRARSGRG